MLNVIFFFWLLIILLRSCFDRAVYCNTMVQFLSGNGQLIAHCVNCRELLYVQYNEFPLIYPFLDTECGEVFLLFFIIWSFVP